MRCVESGQESGVPGRDGGSMRDSDAEDRQVANVPVLGTEAWPLSALGLAQSSNR